MARKNNRSTERALRDLLHPDNSDANLGGSQRQSAQPMVFKGQPLRDMLHPEPKSLIKQAMDFGRSKNAGRQMQTAPSPPQVQRPTFTVPDPLDVNLFPLETTGWRTPVQASTKIAKPMPKPPALTLQQQAPPSDLQIRLREIANRESSGPTDMHPYIQEPQAEAKKPSDSQMGLGKVVGKSLLTERKIGIKDKDRNKR